MLRYALVTLGNHMTILGCYYDDFRWHLRRQLCLCKVADISVSWESPEWVIDHIIPKASFDPLSKTDLRECWHWTNLRPMIRRENLRKHANVQHEWRVPFSVRQQWTIRDTFIGEDGLTHPNSEAAP
jgi:hypothetical protein